MEIECLVCGNTIEIPSFIDTENYDGQINCPACKSLLQVRLFGSKLRKYELVERGGESPVAAESSPTHTVEVEGLNVDSVARYNPLRDYLASYRAAQLNLTFGYIGRLYLQVLVGQQPEKPTGAGLAGSRMGGGRCRPATRRGRLQKRQGQKLLRSGAIRGRPTPKDPFPSAGRVRNTGSPR
jgi:hypothetical protein